MQQRSSPSRHWLTGPAFEPVVASGSDDAWRRQAGHTADCDASSPTDPQEPITGSLPPRHDTAADTRKDAGKRDRQALSRASAGMLGDAPSRYIATAASKHLLSRDEEVQLAKRIEAGRSAAQLLAGRDAQPDGARQKALKELTAAGAEARTAMIEANIRLVLAIARQHLGNGLPLLDLVQEGNLALMHAVDRYDYRKRTRFSTFATLVIRQGIRRAVAKQSRTIRLPVYMISRVGRLRRISDGLHQALAREPTTEEIVGAAQGDWSDDDVANLRHILSSHSVLSLDAAIGAGNEEALASIIAGGAAEGPQDYAERICLRGWLQDLVGRLPQREATVIGMRYGLANCRSHSLAAVGESLGLTRERVRQIEAAALQRLRDQLPKAPDSAQLCD